MIRFVFVDEVEYQELLAIRNRVLRLPLGLDIKDDDLTGEAECHHLAFFNDSERVIGGLQINRINDLVYQIRQMVVLPEYQQSGIGGLLLEVAEDFIRQQGGEEVLVEAREYAIPFYSKHGYEISGCRFYKITLPHKKMIKKI